MGTFDLNNPKPLSDLTEEEYAALIEKARGSRTQTKEDLYREIINKRSSNHNKIQQTLTANILRMQRVFDLDNKSSLMRGISNSYASLCRALIRKSSTDGNEKNLNGDVKHIDTDEGVKLCEFVINTLYETIINIYNDEFVKECRENNKKETVVRRKSDME